MLVNRGKVRLSNNDRAAVPNLEEMSKLQRQAKCPAPPQAIDLSWWRMQIRVRASNRC
jgi:hypothetical protein